MASFSQPKRSAEPAPVTSAIGALPVLMQDHNPLLSVSGTFENDPEYDALMEDVYQHRRQLDACASQDIA